MTQPTRSPTVTHFSLKRWWWTIHSHPEQDLCDDEGWWHPSCRCKRLKTNEILKKRAPLSAAAAAGESRDVKITLMWHTGLSKLQTDCNFLYLLSDFNKKIYKCWKGFIKGTVTKTENLVVPSCRWKVGWHFFTKQPKKKRSSIQLVWNLHCSR